LKIDKIVDNLSDRLARIEEEITEEDSSMKKNTSNNTDPELEKLSLMERYILKFNWYVREVMPYYKAEVMQVHNIAKDEEYTRRILEGDESMYLPQPNRKFEPTHYDERVAHALGLDYQQLQDKFKRGELKHLIATGRIDPETETSWRDEDPNAVF
jgi:hypothetical protein